MHSGANSLVNAVEIGSQCGPRERHFVNSTSVKGTIPKVWNVLCQGEAHVAVWNPKKTQKYSSVESVVTERDSNLCGKTGVQVY